MNQPELGQKVTEIRQLRGLTQEDLAEKCEVSTRTIQRIESGEVDPRTFSLRNLSEVLKNDFDVHGFSDEKQWLIVMHLSSVICSLLVSLLVWTWKKNNSAVVDEQGRKVMNFQITMTLLLFAFSLFLLFFPVGIAAMDSTHLTQFENSPFFLIITIFTPLPLISVGIYCSVMGLANTIRIQLGKSINYPLSIPFLR